jgi:hypothetical protein
MHVFLIDPRRRRRREEEEPSWLQRPFLCSCKCEAVAD